MGKNEKKPSRKNNFKKLGHGISLSLRWIKKHLYFAAGLLLAAALLGAIYAPSYGDRLGNSIGTLVGLAKGTYAGVTEGIAKGAEAGKEEGLSAKDTEVRIGTLLKETQNLQVLQVKFNLSDIYQQGEDYAALFVLPCTGVFTVDLEQSDATYQEDGSMLISIPAPEFKLYYDPNEIEISAEYPSGKTYRGDAKDGSDGIINSLAQLKKKAETEIIETLSEQATAVAEEQVKNLAKSICGQNCSVAVQFEEGGN